MILKPRTLVFAFVAGLSASLSLADGPCYGPIHCSGSEHPYGCFTNTAPDGTKLCCKAVWVGCPGGGTEIHYYPGGNGGCAPTGTPLPGQTQSFECPLTE